MKTFLLAPLVALTALATPAFAQDAAGSAQPTDTMAAPAPTPTSAPDSAPIEGSSTSTFRGFRLEGDAGGDRFQSQGIHRNKFGYGATVGFDGQIGDRIVIGPEGTFWRANNFTENCTGTSGNGTLCNKSFEEFGVGVRAGVLLAPQLLVFGKGGFVTNEQRKRFSSATGATIGYDHYNTDGYQLGGGVELSMANRFQGPLSGLYVNAQYVYSQYSDHTSRQRLMGGVGIRFR